MRNSLCASFAILLLAQVLSSYFSYKKGVYSMAVDPLGALIFAVCAVPWIFTSSLWNRYEDGGGEPQRHLLQLKNLGRCRGTTYGERRRKDPDKVKGRQSRSRPRL
jgi:hypothetical protein